MCVYEFMCVCMHVCWLFECVYECVWGEKGLAVF